MSRIGIQPINLPENVTVTLEKGSALVKGVNGETVVAIPEGIEVSQADNVVTVSRKNELKLTRSLHGTVRALLNNAVTGVSTGWKRQLDIVGSGYRAAVNGKELELHIGYSHTVVMAIPENIEVKVVKNSLVITGHDRQEVGQFAAVIRSKRKPEPYKGKGIKFHEEVIRRKVGKALKSGE